MYLLSLFSWLLVSYGMQFPSLISINISRSSKSQSITKTIICTFADLTWKFLFLLSLLSLLLFLKKATTEWIVLIGLQKNVYFKYWCCHNSYSMTLRSIHLWFWCPKCSLRKYYQREHNILQLLKSSIHPFSVITYSSHGHRWLEPIPAEIGQEAGTHPG